MKYNALFEYVIRTSGENTDDIDDFDDRDNFWAENPLFEWVLKEAGISIQPICPTTPTNNNPQQKNPQKKPKNKKETPEEPQPLSKIEDPNLGRNIDISI